MAYENSNSNDEARSKVLQVFRYLEALNRHRNPVVRLVSEQPWLLWFDELPQHRDVVLQLPQMSTVASTTDDADGESRDSPLLRVRRPNVTEPPNPPPEIEAWLAAGWRDPEWEVGISGTRNVETGGRTETIAFTDDPGRVEAFETWKREWLAWAHAEKPERQAFALFDRLYALHRDLERDSGKFELLVADGHLLWKHSSGEIRHPILLQKVSLSFDPQVPEFLVETDEAEPQLYEALLTSFDEVAPARVRELSQELRADGVHPLGPAPTEHFLRRVALSLGAQGELHQGSQQAPLTEHARITRRPLLLKRNKSHGMAASLAAIIADLESGGEISPALLRIVGVATPVQDSEQPNTDPLAALEEPEKILLGKPSNREQVQIADRLQRHGCVLVQGPPGTGKTHTIGNVIGHLLAQGKKVLVTSHGTKALRVLQRQIPQPLQHLCVSVLDDAESKRQLEVSIGGIAERLGESDPEVLEREAQSLIGQRRDLIAQLTKARRQLRDARADEYRELVFEGERILPSDAAREIAENVTGASWLPGPLAVDRALPLTEGEVLELYSTNRDVPVEDEVELGLHLPDAQALPSVSDFERLLLELRVQQEAARDDQAALWTPVRGLTPARLEVVQRQLERVLEPLSGNESWRLEALEAGGRGGEALRPWNELFDLIRETHSLYEESRSLILKHGPAPKEAQSFDDGSELQLIGAIRAHLETGRSVGTWTLMFRSTWKKAIDRWTLATGPIASAEQALSVEFWLRLSLQRQRLRGRWDRQLGPLGAPASESFGNEPEKVCVQYLSRFEKDLAWHHEEWSPLVATFSEVGLRWSKRLECEPPILSAHAELRRIASAAGSVMAVLRARAAWVRVAELEFQLAGWCRVVDAHGGAASNSLTVRALSSALSRRDPTAYATARARLVELLGRRAVLARRRHLLTRLEPVAPAWASAIRGRSGIHGRTEPPGSARAAWRWRQLSEELDRRSQLRMDSLQESIERLSRKLQETTTDLIERMGWAAQVRRSTHEQRMALMGWLALQRRIGRGTGKRAHILRAAATREMITCRGAVPVWVMTLSQAALSFDASTRFDVVIIDEASQSDVMALAALYLGKQVVVVGDHEQVSPSAVGQNLATVQRLIDTHLEGIPNSQLYDGQLSVYELARQAFGGLVRLREHFRCVPDIIGFSNRLSYENSILPLRDRTSTSLLPAVHEFRVANGQKDDKVNREEARAAAALITAASRHPAYEGKSFGVISLVGEEQALEIERLLRQKLSPAEVERRQLLCGNASQFQGDERDVMFLSMVDSGGDGPLTMRSSENLMFKQRFNVAASRARDQMWVIHSLDPATDLQSGDLRRLLIEHCREPNRRSSAQQDLLAATESAFEKEVLHRLIERGYKVTPQWPVGSFRIDLVVEGRSAKLAVECDGDRYHPLEKLPEDMARQAILERLGWRFVRVRGSAFFRNPDEALAPVFKRLKDLGIEPVRTDSVVAAPSPSDGVRADLVRCMEELLEAWRGEVDEGPPSRPTRRGWGRKSGADAAEATRGQQTAPAKTTSYTLQSPLANSEADLTQQAPSLTDAPRLRVVPPPPMPDASPAATHQHAPSLEVRPKLREVPITSRTSGTAAVTHQHTPSVEVRPKLREVPVTSRTSARAPDADARSVAASTELFEERLAPPTRENAQAAPSQAPVIASSGDSFLDALLAALPSSAEQCASCGDKMTLKVGVYGPYLKCGSARCDQKFSVQMSVISEALKALPAVCQCGARLKVARGSSVFLGCSAYPKCRNTVAWRDFRENMRGTAS